jgi:DNA modification methylase
LSASLFTATKSKLIAVSNGMMMEEASVANKIINAAAIEGLKVLRSETVDTIVTSPPYYGQRDYGVADQLGFEENPETYIAKLFTIFSELHRVLKSNGTLWLNLGDKYIHGDS